MKKLLLLGVFIVLAISAQAQITNAGFETVNPDGMPAYWQRLPIMVVVPLDTSCTMQGAFDSLVLITHEAHTGNNALELRAVNYCDSFGTSGNITPTLYNVDTAFVDQRIPFTDRVAAMTFYYKLYTVKNDFAYVTVLLENDNGQIADGELRIRTASPSWALGTVPLTYHNTDTPAYLTLRFYLASDSITHHGSRFLIDDVSRSGTVGINGLSSEVKAGVHCFPVPAVDDLFINVDDSNNAGDGVVFITDASGRLVKQVAVVIEDGRMHIDVKELPAGIYFLRVSAGGTIGNGRFVK